MKRRRIFLLIGICVLLASWTLCRDGQANSYQSQQGGTLAGISEQLGVIPDILRAANHLTKSNSKPQQVLITQSPTVSQMKSQRLSVPNKKIYHVKKGDSLAKIASKTGVSIVDLSEINRLTGSALKIGQKIELYRSQDGKAAEKARFMEIQVKSELESEEEGDGDTIDDGAWTDVERYEQGNAAPFGQWSNPEEQRLLVNVAIGFLGAPYRWGGFDYRGRLFGICEKNLSVLQHQSSPNRL